MSKSAWEPNEVSDLASDRRQRVTPRILLTTGEPAGVGPDLCVLIAQQPFPCELTVVGDAELLERRAAILGVGLRTFAVSPPQEPRFHEPGSIGVLQVGSADHVSCGRLDPAHAAYVLATIAAGVRACLDGHFDALVTAPVHKGIINESGVEFTGHTEYIAGMTGGYPVMMLVADTLRVALATTHLPLRNVCDVITRGLLETVLRVLHGDLIRRFGIARPRILVCGVNPHAGEGGHLGREEIEVIEPTLEGLRCDGLQLRGPLPADTIFLSKHLQHADAVLAMYHDQGLPVLKYAGFGRAVNITLGLPIIRTSVDHGTALDLAGTGRADAGSMEAAITTAIEMAQRATARH